MKTINEGITEQLKSDWLDYKKSTKGKIDDKIVAFVLSYSMKIIEELSEECEAAEAK